MTRRLKFPSDCLFSKSFRLPSLPGSWELDYGGLTSTRSCGRPEPPRLAPPPGPPEDRETRAPTCHARPSQPPGGPEPSSPRPLLSLGAAGQM